MSWMQWWQQMGWAALGGGLAAVVLLRLVIALISWLDLRVVPPRFLKKRGERRRIDC